MSALHNTFGEKAEDAVSAYLENHGYKIIDRNWKTKWCEIDIVAKKRDTIYFVEVKFRGSDAFGSGFDYITPKKIEKMRRAAESWVLMNSWDGEHVLSAASVSGQQYIVEFIPEIQD